jgi:hypothetical protein
MGILSRYVILASFDSSPLFIDFLINYFPCIYAQKLQALVIERVTVIKAFSVRLCSDF